MKKLIFLLCLLVPVFSQAKGKSNAAAKRKSHITIVTRYGVKGDGKSINTIAFNKAISKTTEGDTLLIPAGKYITGTIHLKSDITILLEEGAEIIANHDLNDFDHYKPTKDMTRYDTGAGSVNSNLTGDERWTKALILGQNLKNVTITGSGIINGQHIEDPLGEESMRGPHTILIAESDGIKVNGIKLREASNYAILGYELTNSEFRGLDIEEGWDGIHIRGGENILITECDIKTGDDALAGGYWKNMTISECRLNSSCNGIRMIEPSTNLTITKCHIYGPGKFPHRTSRENKSPRSIYGIVLEPGAWGDAPGHTENVVIKDVTVDKMLSVLVYSMSENNTCSGLYVDNLRGTHITYNTTPLNRQNTVQMWDNIDLKNVKITMDK